MDDQSDDRKKVTGPRVEVITRSGNRRWPDELKAQIVAVSHLPGAVVAEVARRFECRPQQVHDWRRMAREGLLTLPAPGEAAFASIMIADKRSVEVGSARRTGVEIESKGVVVRLPETVSGARIGEIARALRQAL
jgi:transposase